MKNYKLCHIGEESSTTRKASVNRKVNQLEKHTFKWLLFYII